MTVEIERDLGPQPIIAIMAQHSLTPHQVVAASTEQITHKMITRACKGRRLSSSVQTKIRNALNRAAGASYAVSDLFNYR